MALGIFWQLNILVALVTLGLLVGLVAVYLRNLRDLRSPFTLGLVIFGGLFLVQALMSIFVYLSMGEQGMGPNVAVPMLALNVAGLVGVTTLFFITWR